MANLKIFLVLALVVLARGHLHAQRYIQQFAVDPLSPISADLLNVVLATGPNYQGHGFMPQPQPQYQPSSQPQSQSQQNAWTQQAQQLQQAPAPQQAQAPQQIQQQERPHNFVSVSSSSNNRVWSDQLTFIREFSWDLFQNSKLPSSIGNLVLSPIQPHNLLSLLQLAAADYTKDEIVRTIKESNPRLLTDLVTLLNQPHNFTELGIANAIFTAQDLSLNATFAQESLSRNVETHPVNFDNPEETTYTINNWIARATRNQITSLFKAEDVQSERILMANTIYFRGKWKYFFNDTSYERFESNPRLSKNVVMMKSTASLRSADFVTKQNGLQGRWIEIPYTGNEFSMIVLLPGQRHGLDDLLRSMDASEFSDMFRYLDTSYRRTVHLKLPKFNVQSTYSLVKPLTKMGITSLFANSCKLPFLATSIKDSVHVSDILQQSILSVDETGTTASSATISHVVTLSLNSSPEEIPFDVDQPFLAVIVDKRNKIPLFVGKVFDP